MSRLPPFPLHIDHADLEWRDDMPWSRTFGDVYFSRAGGIAETTYVYIDGNDLQARFRAGGSHHFSIGETGFGTGLNFLVAAREFLALAPAAAVLHFVSVEKLPPRLDDLERTHAHWPELAALSAELRAEYPHACSGFHHRVLAGGRVHLTLLFGDAAALLPRLDARVDAWFLDGFTPARNADLWTPELFAQIARLSAANATFATFTAVGEVKRGLQAAGFTVKKIAGYGDKWDMLRGRYAGAAASASSSAASAPAAGADAAHDQQHVTGRRAAVIGGGLAGCASARALAERGWQVTLFERNATLADETSGNIAGAVYPKFSLHETPQNRWYRDSYLFALARLPQVLGEPDNLRWSRCGLLQLPVTAGSTGGNGDASVAGGAEKLHDIVATGRWPASVLRHVEIDEATALAGAGMPAAALWFPGAAWVNPPALCVALAAHDNISMRLATPVVTLACADGKTQVNDETFDIAVIANALAANSFAETTDLPLRRVRGQVSHVAATDASRQLKAVVCHDGYVTPARNGVHCVGATFGPRDRDESVRADDHAENLGNLSAACPALFAALGGESCNVTGGRTGFRAQTPDYLPLIGAVADIHAAPGNDGIARIPGLYVLAALGAKGIAFSLLGAEIIAALAGGEPLPIDAEVASALDPARFALRARRRQQRDSPAQR